MEGQSTNPTNTPEYKPRSESIIRTYEGDVAQALEKKKASVMTIALAENMQKNRGAYIGNDSESSAPSHLTKKILIAITSIILLGAGGAGGYYLYLQSPLAPDAPAFQSNGSAYKSIVKPDYQKKLDVTALSGKNLASVLNKTLQSSKASPGSMTELILTEKTTIDEKSQISKISIQKFLAKMGITPPDMLTRSLTPSWMIGSFEGSVSEPFIIVSTDFYQNTYSGMIKWEPSMADDLSGLFIYPNSTLAKENGDGTAPPATYFNIRGNFEDAIVKNKDVRIFKNESGETLLMYVFLDKNTLMITQNESALREAIVRLEKQAFVR